MDEDHWMHESATSKEVDMNEGNKEELGVHQHVNCFDALNTSQVLI